MPPTILTPPTQRADAPPPIPRPAQSPKPAQTPQPSARAQAAAPARRSGGGAGLVVGLGVAGVLLVALLAGGGYFLLRRNAAATPPVADVAPTTLAQAPPTTLAAAVAPATTPAEAVPAPPAAATNAPPRASSTPATPPPAPRAAASSAPPASRGTTPSQPAAQPPGQAEPAAGDFSHLDEVPGEDGGDGRAAGDALAQKYRSDGTSSYTTGRYRARPPVPRGITLSERPAVATLLYLSSVEQAYHRRSGRYGTLRELHDAGLLVLDVPVDTAGFKRARYGFRLTVESDGFRAEAVPQAPVGRPFVVDDTGKVRFLD